MDQYSNWEDPLPQMASIENRNIPLPTDDFDQYFAQYNDVDDLFNETLTGLQDLDVPSGFANIDSRQSQLLLGPHHVSPSQNQNSPQSKHSRKPSGTAIFGFSDHNREFSLNGINSDLYKGIKPSVDLSKSVMPGELLKTLHNPLPPQHQQNQQQLHEPSNTQLDFNFSHNEYEFPKPILLKEEDEYEEERDEGKSRENQNYQQPQKQQQVQHEKNQTQPKQQLGSPLKQQPTNSEDFIVTNENPVSYKFPPSPSPPPPSHNYPPSAHSNSSGRSVNSFSVKYLKELNRFSNYTNSPEKGSSQQQLQPPVSYVDDIEPLLNDQLYPEPLQSSPYQQNQNNHVNNSLPPQSTPFKGNNQFRFDHTQGFQASQDLKFVPIPVQEPAGFQKRPESKPNRNYQDMPLNHDTNSNLYLPPPSPPMLSNGSPEWQSSPEPQSPSPSRSTLNQGFYSNSNTVRSNASQFLSPPTNPMARSNKSFYNPQYFSDSIFEGGASSSLEFQSLQQQNQSSPLHPGSLNSSPVRFCTSPLRNVHSNNDDTVDANATITQLTPLRNQLPNTPNRNKIKLEWSPIISPNAKSSSDVRKAIQQSSPRRKIKKTSLLPPGELDQYWIGPDEDKVFTCTYKNCGKKFTRRYNVRSHIQTHLSDRPFGCSYCPKKFVRQHDLNRHVKGHLEARHCSCPCGKEFARLDAMRKHRARNICAGGLANTENSCVSKPTKIKRNNVTSPGYELNSDKLSDELSSSQAY